MDLVRRLRESPVGALPREVVLYEGFITFKSKTTDHPLDARKLVKSFFRTYCPTETVQISPGDAILPVLDVIGGPTAKSVGPAIIAPR